MFERYTEEARRAVFFAHFEASTRGVDRIGLNGLLLGICHDMHTRVNRLTNLFNAAEEFRQRIEAKYPSGKPHPKDRDMELDNPAKRVLAYAAEEAERHKDWWIDSSHLVMGIFREGGFAKELLIEKGLTLEDVRQRAKSDPVPRPPVPDQNWLGDAKVSRASSDPPPRRLAILSAITALIAAIVIILKAS